MRMLRTLFVGWLVAGAMATPSAAQYPCPADPGFCYFDIGNDGCFDPGTDTGPINADLQGGSFPMVGPPSPGSIVCPPSVGVLTVTSDASWTTATGGDVLLFLKKVLTPGPSDLSINSGRDVLIAGLVRTHDILIDAEGDILVPGKIRTVEKQLGVPMVNLTASQGKISLGPRSSIKDGDIVLETLSGGEIALSDKATILTSNGVVGLVSSGTLMLSNSKIYGGEVNVDAQSIAAVGNVRLKSFPSGIGISATGSVEFEQLAADAKGQFAMLSISGDTVRVGAPNMAGVVRTSSLKPHRSFTVSAAGDVSLEKLVVETTTAIIETLGTSIQLTDSKFSLPKNPFGSPESLEVTAGPGSTCDVTGTSVKEMAFSVSCDTVIGP